jgi:hypothetical protein
MNEQNLTLEQKLDIMYNLTKEVNLKYNEHAIIQQYYNEIKESLKPKVENSPF